MIATQRLSVRPYEKSDYAIWRDLYKSEESERTFADRIADYEQAAQKDDIYQFGVFRNSDEQLIGKVEVYTILRMSYDWGMVGYSLHPQFQGRGYGVEMVHAACEYFFSEKGFRRLEAHIVEENQRSINLAKRAGFAFECIREKFAEEDNVRRDYHIYYKNGP
ncbi:GNAT family N-acetyltransferase [Geomicrobium sp. JSM 1781026]|uniref:GNAT family N-acetyltransferase n=1 Tax=Geomicrobium sp. JSM 1781026 TaxID=3344580 RepID=UPI0035C00998